MSDHIIVYTAIADGYDPLLPAYQDRQEGVRYIAFLDEKTHAKETKNGKKLHKLNWEILPLDVMTDSPHPWDQGRRIAKAPKVLSHLFLPKTLFSIWVDGNHFVKNPNKIVELLKETDIGVFKHPDRECAYDESNAAKPRDPKGRLDEQRDYYRSRGFPAGEGLYQGGCLARRHTPSIAKMNMLWWEQICRFSARDQVSLPYVLNLMGISPTLFPGRQDKGDNPLFGRGSNH